MQLFIELFKHYIIKNIHWKHTNKIYSTLNRNEVDDCTRFRKYTQLLNIIVLTFTKLAAFFWMSGSANLPWEYAKLLPLDLSLKSFPGTSPVALPLRRIHTGTILKTWLMYVAHSSAVIWVLQNRKIQSCSSCLVRGTSLATVLLSSFQTIWMGFKSGLSN